MAIDRSGVSRRDFLEATAWLAASTALGPDISAVADQRPMDRAAASLLSLSAGEAVDRMREGSLSAEAYASALLARCAEATALNAFITLVPEQVLEAARAADLQRARGASLGPLHGLPIPIKDSLNTRDYPTTGGTPALRQFRPLRDAPVVEQLVSAGAIVMGKTNLHELSYGWTSNNHAFGAVRNPYDVARSPGGSSGGTAAAVAARLAPLGVAEDTEGSIRVPAAWCGLAGFRPTTGRYSTEGAIPISPLFDQVGPHARCIRDLVLFDTVIAPKQPTIAVKPLKGVRLAIGRGYWYAGLDPDVERVTGEALDMLRRAGAVLIEEEVPDLKALIDQITGPVQNHDVSRALPAYLARYGAEVSFDEIVAKASDDIQAVFASYVLPGGANYVTDVAYHAAVHQHLPRLKDIFRRYFAKTGAAAIVFPTTRITAPLVGDPDTVEIGGKVVGFESAVARNIAPGSTAGLPGLVMPVGLSRLGLPVSLEFDGPAGSDHALLGLGLALEQVLGTLPAPRV